MNNPRKRTLTSSEMKRERAKSAPLKEGYIIPRDKLIASKEFRQFSKSFNRMGKKSKGTLTNPGENVSKLISSTNSDSKLFQLMRISQIISAIPMKRVSLEVLKKTYASRSAESVLAQNEVHIPLEKDEKALGLKRIGGCVDYAHVSVAALKELGFPAAIFRVGRHATAIFKVGTHFLVMDSMPNVPKESQIRPLSELELHLICTEKALVGPDAKSIGLSFNNFN